jgi:hypothetical protein
MPSRKPTLYIPYTLLVVCLGLLSRKFSYLLPDGINTYLGDALWAVMIYLMMATIGKSWSVNRVALYSILFCYVIELSQLYHAPWIDAIRNTRLGGLVLGFGFLWSDIIAYSIGVTTMFLIEKIIHKKPKM